MRLGALVLQKEPWVQARDTWRQVERAGFDIGYVADHLTHSTVAGQWWADGWTTLAAAAEATSTLGIGTLVGSAAIRGPAFIARVAATLQDISGVASSWASVLGRPLTCSSTGVKSWAPRCWRSATAR